jgi:hypothetical protein
MKRDFAMCNCRFDSGNDAVGMKSVFVMYRCDCDALRRALDGIPGAERMVVGHTIQEQGINSACEERVYRIDVGMSRGCGDSDPEVGFPKLW